MIKTTIAAVAMVLAAAFIAMAADGKANGTFTVKGKVTKLAYAYAKAQPDPSNKAKEEIIVIVSDVPLAPELLKESMPFGMQDLTKAGKLHALRATIDSSKALTGISMFDSAFKMSSVSVGGTYLKLDLQTLDQTTIAGKLYTAKPLDFNDVPYEYSVSFSAPIVR